MRVNSVSKLVGLFLVCSLAWSCADLGASRVTKAQIPQETKETVQREQGPADMGWTERIVTEDELEKLAQKDADLDPSSSRMILARLNTKATCYVSEDIRKEKPLKVPNDFAAYKNWTPLPRHIPEMEAVSKSILIAKDIPFLGWYERGALKGDTHVCIGKRWDMTKAGKYRVEDKYTDYYSRSYPNAFGEPAWMPWSMRIYGGVFIHAGDITMGYCSPGCIVLPMAPAEELYHWAPVGTTVLVLDSLSELEPALNNRVKSLSLGR
jgi:hypothetical protein